MIIYKKQKEFGITKKRIKLPKKLGKIGWQE